ASRCLSSRVSPYVGPRTGAANSSPHEGLEIPHPDSWVIGITHHRDFSTRPKTAKLRDLSGVENGSSPDWESVPVAAAALVVKRDGEIEDFGRPGRGPDEYPARTDG